MNTCDKDYGVVVAQGKKVYKAVVGALYKSNYDDIGTRTFPVLRVKIKGVVFQKGGCKYELNRRWVVVDGENYAQFYTTPHCDCLHMDMVYGYSQEQLQEAFAELLG